MLQSPAGAKSPLDSATMQGTLWKWTNYLSGWQPRWFVLEQGVLSYFLSPNEVNQACRGSLKIGSCDIIVHPTDHQRLDIVMPGGRHIYLRAASTAERQQWLINLGSAKQGEFSIEPTASSEKVRGDAVKSKIAELHINCQLLVTQITNIKVAVATPQPDVKSLTEMSNLVTTTCDTFLNTLAECMDLSYGEKLPTGLKPLLFSSGRHSGVNSPSQSPAHHALTPGRMAPPKGGQTMSNSFSEGELYPTSAPGLHPRTHPIRRTKTTPTTPSDSKLTFSLPAHLSGMRKAERGGGGGEGEREVSFETTSLPISPSRSSDKQQLEPESLFGSPSIATGPDSKPTGSGTMLGMEPLSHSHDSTDSGPVIPHPSNQESTSRPEGVSNHELQTVAQNGSPTHVRTAALRGGSEKLISHLHQPSQVDDSASSIRSSPRSNSELFLTPTSSPLSTPPPSPRINRIGDLLPANTRTSQQIETFFSRAPQKFEDLVLRDEDGIPTAEFLDCCRAVVPFFDTLSPTAFSPVKSDINGNIKKLSLKFSAKPQLYVTLQSMVLQEMATNTHTAKNSATDALLWLKRAMEFIQIFIAEVAAGEQSLDVAAGKAYSQSLRRFHNWIVRGIFSLAVKAVPYRQDFLVVLGSDGSLEGEEAVIADMLSFAHSLGQINNILNGFYQKQNLDTPPEI